jgi:hypothetical protein
VPHAQRPTLVARLYPAHTTKRPRPVPALSAQGLHTACHTPGCCGMSAACCTRSTCSTTAITSAQMHTVVSNSKSTLPMMVELVVDEVDHACVSRERRISTGDNAHRTMHSTVSQPKMSSSPGESAPFRPRTSVTAGADDRIKHQTQRSCA